MRKANILLVEGKDAREASLRHLLLQTDQELIVANSFKGAMNLGIPRRPALVVFDAATLDQEERRSCGRLHRMLARTPLIHVRGPGMAKDETAGATVYLQRPFTPRKLLNRVRALLPADYRKEVVVRAGDITLFLNKKTVAVADRDEQRLTPRLVRLLEEFLRYPNQVVSRRQLMQHVWQTDYIGDTRTLDVHIRWAREAIESDPSRPQRLVTVRGQGYVFRVGTEEQFASAAFMA